MGRSAILGTQRKGHSMKKPLILIGIFFLALSGIYKFILAPQLTIRIPKDWSIQAEYLGDQNFAGEDGVIPQKRDVNVYKRNWTGTQWSPQRTVIRDVYKTYDIHSGKVTWASQLEFVVDPKTGMNLSYPGHPEAAGTYYLFPQNTEKKDYTFFDYSLNRQMFKFDRVEKFDNLDLNVYGFRGDLDFEEVYKGTDDYPGFKPEAGQTIIGFDIVKEFWVEPITGEFVKIYEESVGGDYYADKKTKKKIAGISSWKGETTGNTVELLVQRAREKMFLINLHRGWIPGILFFAGMILLPAGMLSKRKG
jgi:hypothetical protein